MKKEIFWIGARQSDVGKNDFLNGTITRYGNNIDNNFAFDKNNFTNNYNYFLSTTLSEILSNNPNAQFMFSNSQVAYSLGKNIFDNSICLNNISTIDSLNNKIFMRNYLNKIVHTPISIVINSNSAKDYSFVKSVFDNKYTDFVFQDAISAGGNKSILVNSENTFCSEKFSDYILITPFIKDSLSINMHIIMSQDDYRLFQPSLQITTNMFNYAGSDFIKYNELDDNSKKQIIDCGNKIANYLKKLNAKGIFGIDLLLKDNDLYFLECNFRYQGSTCLLNFALIDQNYPSIYELIYNSFYKDLNSLPKDSFNIPINYSSFRRTVLNKNIVLPTPNSINDVNTSKFASLDGYLQYEIYKKSIFNYVEKQSIQNPY